MSALDIYTDIQAERVRQDAAHGTDRHQPDGLDVWFRRARVIESHARMLLDACPPTWAAIFAEEVGEALRATTQEHLREELVQVAAVCVAWIEDIDRRAAHKGTETP